MIKFNLEDFKNKKIAINCRTKKEAKRFLTYLHNQGLSWGETSLLKKHNWDKYKENTCYDYLLEVFYSNIKFYQDLGCNVIRYDQLYFKKHNIN